MKNLKQLYDELKSRKDFRIIRTDFDGGMGEFIAVHEVVSRVKRYRP